MTTQIDTSSAALAKKDSEISLQRKISSWSSFCFLLISNVWRSAFPVRYSKSKKKYHAPAFRSGNTLFSSVLYYVWDLFPNQHSRMNQRFQHRMNVWFQVIRSLESFRHSTVIRWSLLVISTFGSTKTERLQKKHDGHKENRPWSIGYWSKRI